MQGAHVTRAQEKGECWPEMYGKMGSGRLRDRGGLGATQHWRADTGQMGSWPQGWSKAGLDALFWFRERSDFSQRVVGSTAQET